MPDYEAARFRRRERHRLLERDRALEVPVAVRCALCGFVVEAPIAVARPAFLEHGCDKVD